jgi:20S proteasome alpha/beta subunit
MPIADLAARYYCLSLLDKHHQPDIDLERGMELLTLCADELKRRLPIDFKGLIVKVVTKDGIKEMPFDNDKVVKGT